MRRTRAGVVFLTQPPLTPALGPWLRPSFAKYSKALAREKAILSILASSLPDCDVYQQNWNVERKNWLPFFWNGFQQTTRYTYQIEDLHNKDQLWSNLQENTRREIRKARQRFELTVRPAKSIQEFLELNQKTFGRQGRSAPYSERLVKRIAEQAKMRNALDVLVTEDPQGKLHAGAFVVRWREKAFYLMGGGDPDLRISGAASLCIWEAISQQPQSTKIFDFEGSMIEPIERFFRGFGAEQTPYFHVSKSMTLKGSLALALLRWRQKKSYKK